MICAGFGFRAACLPEDLTRAFEAALASAQRQREHVVWLAAPAFKPPLVAALAAQLGIPLASIPLAALQACPLPTLTQSAHVAPRYGVGSIAEGCALVCALQHAPHARLLSARVSAGSATCALAISESSS
jgi:cobalt-precorrin 5A hydrolase